MIEFINKNTSSRIALSEIVRDPYSASVDKYVSYITFNDL